MSTINASSLASSWASSIFSKLDTSNQGYIDKTTLQSAFDQMSSSSSGSAGSTSVDGLFSSIDNNSDGKITQSELSASLEKLASKLNDAFDQMRMGGGHGHRHGGMQGAGGPPPGPPPADGSNTQDTGFTKDELTQQLSEIGSSDSKRSQLLSDVVNNFSKADTDGDGKVTFQEAKTLEKSLHASSSGSSGSSTSGNSDGSSGSGNSSGTGASSEAALMKQIMKLTQAYGMDANSTLGLLASSLSVSA